MIVPMKKITLLLLASEQLQALETLRDLGVMHVAMEKPAESRDRAELTQLAARLERVITVLSSVREIDAKAPELSGEEAFRRTQEILAGQETLTRELEQANRWIDQLAPWGDFDPAMVGRLREQGVFVYLCEAPQNVFNALAAEPEYTVREISRRGALTAFALITQTPPADPGKLPLARLPENVSLAAARRSRAEAEKRLQQLDRELAGLAGSCDKVREYAAAIDDELNFAAARDSLAAHGEIVVLEGFVPEPAMKRFAEAAKQNHWGYLATTPDPVLTPTLLKMPKWITLVRPLFDFLGISPGYNEVDASWVILVFFTIFFGILIGDAGYGALFLALSLPMALRSSGKKRLCCTFISILSMSAIVWGILTNNYFGLSPAALKPLECPALSSSPQKDANVQFLCFILGALQLSIGHFWRMLRDGRWRNVGSQLGWLSMMTANFCLLRTMIVYPGTTQYPPFMVYCYIGGILLVALCEVNWTDPGSILGFPFSLVNSFVDLLSYIRLFAVGMAGYYLAFSFNDIARGLMTDAGGIVAGIAILLIGHLLNIGLAVLAVLVHGVRLNTLEFSSHIGLQWGGFAFRPFARNDSRNSQ